MKILFRHVSNPATLIAGQSSMVDELVLPETVLTQLVNDLQLSNESIPDRARVIQDWNVGLLDRFDTSI